MRPKVQLALVFLVIAGISVAAILRWLDPEPAVYEIALSSISSYDVAVASSPSTCGAEQAHFKGISPNLVGAFQLANAPGASPGNISRLSDHFAIANSTQLAAFESQGLVPQAVGSPQIPVLRLSRVGFNSDKSEALFCMRARLGSTLFHLRKINGAWQVATQESISVAVLMQHNYSLKRTAASRHGVNSNSFAAAAA